MSKNGNTEQSEIQQAHNYLVNFAKKLLDPSDLRNMPNNDDAVKFKYNEPSYEYELSRIDDDYFLKNVEKIFRPDYGIVDFDTILEVFRDFDVVNDYVNGEPYVNYAKEIENNVIFETDMVFAEQVLFVTLCNEIDDFMKRRTRDGFVAAAISWLCQWPVNNLLKLQERVSTFANHFNKVNSESNCRACGVSELINALLALKTGGNFFFRISITWKHGIVSLPFIRFPHKILRKLQTPECTIRNIGKRECADLFDIKMEKFVFGNKKLRETLVKLHKVMVLEIDASPRGVKKLRPAALRQEIESIIRDDITKLHAEISTNIDTFIKKNPPAVTYKYFTGVAGTGKSTILEKLKKNNWKIYSRGDLGGYSAKHYDQITVTQLNFALGQLVHDRVIGDRGFSDNPLWCLIMSLVNGAFHNDSEYFVDNLMAAMCKFASESAMLFYRNMTDFVTIVDISSTLNKNRMLNRCESGDGFRARIRYYVIAQVFAYIMNALIFSKYDSKFNKLITVPYNSMYTEMNYEEQNKNADMINKYFEYVLGEHKKRILSFRSAGNSAYNEYPDYDKLCDPSTEAFSCSDDEFVQFCGIKK